MRKFYIMSLIYILVYNLGYSFQFTGKVVDGKTGMPIVEANISFENLVALAPQQTKVVYFLQMLLKIQ